MDKSTKKVLLGTATLAALSVAAASPAAAATTSVSIDAEIVGAIAITSTVGMDFGQMSVLATKAGTVTVDNADTRAAGGAGGVSLVGGTGATSGVLNVTAATGSVFDLNVTADTRVIKHTTATANTMKVTGFSIDGAAVGIATTISRSITAGTTKAYKMGGVLSVSAGQVVGKYAGTVTVNATYQ